MPRSPSRQLLLAPLLALGAAPRAAALFRHTYAAGREALRAAPSDARPARPQGGLSAVTARQSQAVVPFLEEVQTWVQRANSIKQPWGEPGIPKPRIPPFLPNVGAGQEPSLEEVVEIVVQVLGAFKDGRFVNATYSGLENISASVSHFTNETTDNLEELETNTTTVAASNRTEAINAMKDFFYKEARLIGHLSVTVSTAVKTIARYLSNTTLKEYINRTESSSGLEIAGLEWTKSTFTLVAGFLEGYFDDIFSSEDPAVFCWKVGPLMSNTSFAESVMLELALPAMNTSDKIIDRLGSMVRTLAPEVTKTVTSVLSTVVSTVYSILESIETVLHGTAELVNHIVKNKILCDASRSASSKSCCSVRVLAVAMLMGWLASGLT